MVIRRHIFLTGATGLIGRFLLRDYLAQGHRVTTLVRSRGGKSGMERIEKTLHFARLPRSVKSNIAVLEGDLPDYQPDATDRRAIQKCDRVVHSAASLSFHQDSQGEPFRTNVEGTRRLTEVAHRLGIRRWIQVSTAYVCGNTQALVGEEDTSLSVPRNYYERSKRAAEEMIRSQPNFDWTILRPGIVVGDSQNGYTSTYQGIYRCLQSVALLARRLQPGPRGTRRLPIRFHLTGDERTNLVPVDWVAAAIARLSLHPHSVGKHFHLTPRRPITAGALVDAVQRYFGITGIEFVGTDKIEASDRNAYERVFDRETSRLGPYFNDDPHFDRSQLNELLPNLPEVDIDDAFIRRLLSFAEADGWGIRNRSGKTRASSFNCQEFFESHFFKAAGQSQLTRIRELSALIGFDVSGPDGGHWICQLVAGDVASIERTSRVATEVDFHYQTDCKTLQEITSGQVTTRDAFFEKRIQIVGDIERALLLALLFEDLLREFPYRAGMGATTSPRRACA